MENCKDETVEFVGARGYGKTAMNEEKIVMPGIKRAFLTERNRRKRQRRKLRGK